MAANPNPTRAEGHISAALESMYNMMVQMVNHRGSPSSQGLTDELETLSRSLTALATQPVTEAPADSPSPPFHPPQPMTNGSGPGAAAVAGSATQGQGPEPATPLSPPLTNIPADIVEYVGRGRNPDIYTREFYELAIRNNQALRGKSEVFSMFRDVLAQDLALVEPELRGPLEQMGLLPPREGDLMETD